MVFEANISFKACLADMIPNSKGSLTIDDIISVVWKIFLVLGTLSASNDPFFPLDQQQWANAQIQSPVKKLKIFQAQEF